MKSKNIPPSFFGAPGVDISVEAFGKKLINPFLLAAAPPTDEIDMLRRAFDLGWAGAVLKTTNLKGAKENLVYPLIARFEGSAECLGNSDLTSAYSIDEIEKRVAIFKKEFPDRAMIVSISGADEKEWRELSRRASLSGADFIECSFSCPQGSLGLAPGMMLAQDRSASKEVASWICNSAGKTPVIIKLTPWTADVLSVAKAVIEAGASGVCLGNTVPAILINHKKQSPEPCAMKLDQTIAGTTVGFSGPAIRPISLKAIASVAANGVPVIASGGAVSWSDALEFMEVGAVAVEFATAPMIYGLDIIEDLCSGLKHHLEAKNITSLGSLLGCALSKIVSHDELAKGCKIRPNIDLDKCIGDGACVIACRDGGHMAIELDDKRKPKVDDQKCVGCGLCSSVCPLADCIKMEKA